MPGRYSWRSCWRRRAAAGRAGWCTNLGRFPNARPRRPAYSCDMETLRDGSRVTIRPITKTDLELERRFIEELSPESRRSRFLYSIGTPSEALLKKLTDLDEQREAALIAVIDDGLHQREVGVARFSRTPDGRAEVAVTVSDDWQRRGLGTLLMKRLIELARLRGIRALYST